MADVISTVAMVVAIFYGMGILAWLWWELGFVIGVLDWRPALPLRGLAWRALVGPLPWFGIAFGFLWRACLLPERRPRPTRTQLEGRIADLERELDMEERS